MPKEAEFKSKRLSNLGIAVVFFPLSAGIVWFVLYGNEAQFLHTHVRRGGGLLKLVEQTIGWPAFCFLMLVFGAWLFLYAIVSMWKVIDTTADITAFNDRIEFHPAVRRSAASYDDISHWKIEFVSGHPVVWIHLREAYWSLQGMFKRKTVKLEGGKDELTPLVDFFSHHPAMANKFVR